MAELADLEARVRVLEDIEAIKKLKFKYWHCLDGKLWDELGDCFAEDIVINYPTVKSKGRKANVQFLKGRLGDVARTSIHQGHNPEIELTSDTTAKGIWALYDYIHDVKENTSWGGWASYEDEYAKENGEWKIKSTTLTRIHDLPSTAINTIPQPLIS